MAKQPTIMQRARLAMQVFRGGMPSRRVFPSEQMKLPYAWPSWRENQPQWTMYDFSSYVREGYTLNSVIHSAIRYKASASAVPKMKAYGGDPEQPEELDANHPMAQIVKRPNPQMSWRMLQMLATIYLNVAGNYFCMLDRENKSAYPRAMYPLRPDRVYIIPGKGGIKGYAYVPEGESIYDGFPILPTDMIHVKFPNPNDPFEGMGYGLSPIAPMAQSADVDNMITRYIKLFFQNGAMPPGYITYQNAHLAEDLQAAKARWMEVYGGYENWAEIAVLDDGAKYERAGLTFDEMGFESLDYRNEERMTGPFGVPAALIGLRYGLENSGIQANIEELRSVFWEDTMLHELMLFQDAYQYHLNMESGEFVEYDLSDVPALSRDLVPLIDGAKQLFDMGVPANLALAALNIPVGEIPGGDVGYLPLSLMPVGEERPEPSMPPVSVSVPELPAGETQTEDGQVTAAEDERQEDGKSVDAVAERVLLALEEALKSSSPKV